MPTDLDILIELRAEIDNRLKSNQGLYRRALERGFHIPHSLPQRISKMERQLKALDSAIHMETQLSR